MLDHTLLSGLRGVHLLHARNAVGEGRGQLLLFVTVVVYCYWYVVLICVVCYGLDCL